MTDEVEVRYSMQTAEKYQAGAERSVLYVKVAGVVGSVAVAALALLMMEGLVRWLLLAMAVVELPIFLWYLPRTITRGRGDVTDVHLRNGVVFTLAREGVIRPQPRVGDKLIPWSEAEMSRRDPSANQSESTTGATRLRVRLGDENLELLDTALSPSVSEILDAEQALRA